jgi:hypothetical protein
MKLASALAILLLGLIALGHLVRLILGLEILIGGFRIPPWMSLPATLVLGGVAILLFLENRR